MFLLDARGEQLKHFDPGTARQNRTAFSWAAEGGEHYLMVAEPPVSVVLIWDTSGSMEGNTEDLERAVETYLDNLRPGEQLNLIRFGEDVEVLLPDFTDDKEQLKAAIKGKFQPKVAPNSTTLLPRRSRSWTGSRATGRSSS